jgi:hypothetical protein
VHDLFQAFSNLNNYFDQLVAYNHLRFHIELRKNDSNHFQCPNGLYLPDSVLDRILSLQSLDENRYVYISRFFRFNSDKLIRLQSLIIKLHAQDFPTICIVLQELNSLRYLHMKCAPNNELLKAILTSPTLLICKSDISQSNSIINGKLSKISHIEKLYLMFNDVSNHSITNFLLSNMPKLRNLEIVERKDPPHTTNPLFSQPLLEQLRTLKISIDYHYIKSKLFRVLFFTFKIKTNSILFTSYRLIFSIC